MMQSEKLIWRCCAHTFFCGERTLVAGVLNVTPDSFSDGGRFDGVERALAQVRAMINAGADMIDIGGESSRPGSLAVELDEELERVIPIVDAIRSISDIPLSIDTTKAEVARQGIEQGAEIINDVTALQGDPEMAEVVARSGAGVVLMHMRGKPTTMQEGPAYDDVVEEVEDFLGERIAMACAAGIEPERICIDPGIGFGKRLEDNLELIAAGWRFRQMGAPVLVGLSRKSFIGTLLDLPVEERLEGSLAANVAAILHGADIVRVHDVGETHRAVQIADAIKPYAAER